MITREQLLLRFRVGKQDITLKNERNMYIALQNSYTKDESLSPTLTGTMSTFLCNACLPKLLIRPEDSQKGHSIPG
jgi:hypothetical protein